MPGPKGPRSSGGRRGGAAKPVKRGAPGADNASGTRSGSFELAELRRLIDLVQSTGIGELEVTSGGKTIRIAAASGATPVTTGASPEVAAAHASEPAAEGLDAATSY